MNKLYADRNVIPVDSKSHSTGTEVLDRVLESRRESKERSAQILDYYRFNKAKKENKGGLKHGIQNRAKK